MFNGIIEEVGKVMEVKSSTGKEFTFQATWGNTLAIGDSVSVNGVCTTVTQKDGDGFRIFASEQTLALTNLDELKDGDLVNLERSLIYGSRINGHIVYGHVDKTLTLLSVEKKPESWLFTFGLIPEDTSLVIPKGSIALNGISLTIYNLTPDHLTVMVIPHTFKHTNLFQLKPGDRVNCEFDSLGKFIQQHMENYLNKQKLN